SHVGPRPPAPVEGCHVNIYSLTHLSDDVLRRELTTGVTDEKQATAWLLARIAEFDERKLYLPEAYPSMFAYCTGALHLSEDAAKKRIQIARVGRSLPGVFEALAEGTRAPDRPRDPGPTTDARHGRRAPVGRDTQVQGRDRETRRRALPS